MPNAAIKVGKKKSRLSTQLAAALSLGAQVPGVDTGEEEEEVTTGLIAVVVDGKPLLDKDGKPVMTKDGKPPVEEVVELKAVMDADGKPVMGEDGKPLMTADGKLPKDYKAPAKETTPPTAEQTATDLAAANARIAELTTQLTSKGTIVDHLQTQLNASVAKVGNLETELTTVKAKNIELTTGSDLMRAVVVNSINRLGVALNSQVVGLENLDAANLVKQHNELNSTFEKRYVVGGKTKATTDDTAKPEDLLSRESENRVASAAAKVTQLPRKR